MSGDGTKRGFGAVLGAEVLAEVESGATLPKRTHLQERSSALSRRAEDIVYSTNEWVDPKLCKPSPINARLYDALTYDDCAELIDQIIAEGQQRIAATVRPTNDPEVPYEIVAGSRRHWAISWLRANSYPDFKYLINVQKLDDEAAFRFSDLENRARADVTDLERAVRYRKALPEFYQNDAKRMAQRIGISERNLWRFFQLADLDPIFVDALGGMRYVNLSHSQAIAPALKKSPHHANLILEAARDLAGKQKERAAAGETRITAPDAVKMLLAAGNAKPAKQGPAHMAPVEVEAANGKPMIRYVPRTAKQGIDIKILPNSGASPDEIKAALIKLVDEVHAPRAGGSA